MTDLTGHNWIAGTPSREGDRTFTSINPRTREPGDIAFADATPAEIDRAVTAAAHAFEALRHASAQRLAEFLDRIADEIEALGDELLQTADWETELGIPRLTGERSRTTGQLRKFGALLREGSYVGAIIDTAQPDRQPGPRPDIRRMLFPIGPVGVFSASNFPFAFAVAGGDTASAFAAGCPVIVKGHPGHPATSELFARAIGRAVEACGFPPGTFSLLQGAGTNVGQILVQHPLLEAVGFTGSLRGGRALFDTAARRPRPIPVYAEMGSVNPVFLLPGAVRAGGEALAEGIAASVTLGAGQFCTNPGLILVQEGPDSAALIDGITARMSARAPGVLLNESIQRGLAQTVAGTLARPDVVQLTGGAIVACAPYCFDNTVMQTTAAALLQDDALQTEHFGPVTLIVVCASEDEMLRSGPPSTRQLERVDPCNGRRRRRSGSVGGHPARESGPPDLERLPDRRRSGRQYAARRAIPGHNRARDDLGRHDGHHALFAPGGLPECATVCPAGRAARRESARHLARRGRRADPRSDRLTLTRQRVTIGLTSG